MKFLATIALLVASHSALAIDWGNRLSFSCLVNGTPTIVTLESSSLESNANSILRNAGASLKGDSLHNELSIVVSSDQGTFEASGSAEARVVLEASGGKIKISCISDQK